MQSRQEQEENQKRHAATWPPNRNDKGSWLYYFVNALTRKFTATATGHRWWREQEEQVEK